MNNKKNTLLYISIILLCLNIISLFRLARKLTSRITEQKEQINLTIDSISYYRDEFNNEVAKNQLILVENTTQLELLRTQTKEIQRLKDLIKRSKPKQIYTVVNTETKIDTIMKLDTIVTQHDFRKDFTLDRWADGTVAIKKDTLALALRIHNEYDVTIGSEKGVPYAEVTNHNPYTTTTSMRALKLLDNRRQKRFGIGLHAGYGITPTGLQPYVGLGINYNLYSF